MFAWTFFSYKLEILVRLFVQNGKLGLFNLNTIQNPDRLQNLLSTDSEDSAVADLVGGDYAINIGRHVLRRDARIL